VMNNAAKCRDARIMLFYCVFVVSCFSVDDKREQNPIFHAMMTG
jgi:hypothetical protein